MKSFIRHDRLIVACVLLSNFLALSGATAATSQGCSAINSGAWNIQLFSQEVNVLVDFNVGDRINLSITGTGSFQLVGLINGSNMTTLLNIAPPGSGSYTVAPPSNQFGIYDSGSGNINVQATCTPASSPAPVNPNDSSAVKGLTKAFLQARVNGILMNDASALSLRNRGQTAAGPMSVANAANTGLATSVIAAASASDGMTGAGVNPLAGSDSITSANNISFATSLSRVRRDAAKSESDRYRMALGAGEGGALPTVYDTYSPWDLWAEGRFSGFDDDNTPLVDRSGYVGVLYLGGDYRVLHNVIVGALVQIDWAKDSSDVLASKATGTGWMAGPYMSMQVNENVFLDLRAAAGTSSNNLTLNGGAGSFDTTRWMVKGTLAGNWYWDNWRLTPIADLAYLTENADGFSTTRWTYIPGQNVSLGRLQFGPEFGYNFSHTPGVHIEPFAAIKGVWDFDNPNVAVLDGYVVGPGDFWARLQGGLNVVTLDGLIVRGQGSWDGVGASNYSGYSVQGSVNVPLN